MAWYKFNIYFRLWVTSIIHLMTILSTITALMHSGASFFVCVFIAYNVALLALTIRTHHWLYRFHPNGLLWYFILFYIPPIINVIGSLILLPDEGSVLIMSLSPLLIAFAMFFFELTYWNKRAFLFCEREFSSNATRKNSGALSATENTNCGSVVINKNLGRKWFFFYARVRPFIACAFFVSGAIEFFQYTEVYLSNFWLLLYFIVSVTWVTLGVIVFIKSFGDYRKFVRFIYGVLLFETIAVPYQQGVQQYIKSGYDLLVAFIVFVVILVLAYFLWYRLNIKYFERRLSNLASDCPLEQPHAKTQNPELYKSGYTESSAPRMFFCRKCGTKLPENARFCIECGTEIITKVDGMSNDMQ